MFVADFQTLLFTLDSPCILEPLEAVFSVWWCHKMGGCFKTGPAQFEVGEVIFSGLTHPRTQNFLLHEEANAGVPNESLESRSWRIQKPGNF